MVKRIAAVAAALAFGSVVATSSPASANFQFSPQDISGLAALMPDTCIPVGTSGMCITFTNASYLTQLATARNSTQMGQMLAQGLTDGKLGSLGGDFGISDPTGFDAGARIAAAVLQHPSSPSYYAALATQLQADQQKKDAEALYSAMDADGGQSPLAAAQLTGVATMNVAAQLATANQLAAARVLQDQQVSQSAMVAVGSLLDLNNKADPSAGFNF
jgi:hypothetical protein